MKSLKAIIIPVCLFAIASCQTGITKITYSSPREAYPKVKVLFNNRDKNSEDSVLIGGFRWGMTAEELNSSLQEYVHTDFFFPNKWTCSSISIGSKRYDSQMRFGFDINGCLRYIEMAMPMDKETLLSKDLSKQIGGNSIIAVPKADKDYYNQIWYDGNSEYLLYKDIDCKLEKVVLLCISDVNHTDDVYYCPLSTVDCIKSTFSEVSRGKISSIFSQDYGIFNTTVSYNGNSFEIQNSGFNRVLSEAEADSFFQDYRNSASQLTELKRNCFLFTTGTVMTSASSAPSETKESAYDVLQRIEERKKAGQDAYYESVNREKLYKEMGMDDLAKKERKDRQNKIRSGEYSY